MAALPLQPKIIGRVKAIYSYYSEESSALSFKRGDQIDVLAKLDSGWWDGWCSGQRGWFPSNYVETIVEDIAPVYPRPPDTVLPNIPIQLQNYIDSNRSVASGSNGSEVSRNNPNLPDGWTIQMAPDGRTWHYYNEYTGRTSNQYPTASPTLTVAASITGTGAFMDHDTDLIIDQGSINRESFATDQPNEVEAINNSKSEPAPVKTSKELMDNWVERKTPQGRVYFCNLVTQETTWDYDEIDSETGRLKKNGEDEEEEEYEREEDHPEPSNNPRFSVQEDMPAVEILTWNKLAADIALAIHQLTSTSQKGQHDELQAKTVAVVQSVRLMLYASRAMEKDSPVMSDPIFREPRRSVMSSLSKLVLSSKMGSEISEFTTSVASMFQKVQKDANDVLIAVRSFVTVCQRTNVTVNYVNPRLLDDISQLPFEPPSINPATQRVTNLNAVATESLIPTNSNTTLTSNASNGVPTDSGIDANNSLTQKGKYLLNQDLVLSLQAYAHQIYTSTEELSLKASEIKQKFNKKEQGTFDEEKSTAVSMFRILSGQITQYIGVLDDISLENIDFYQIPSIAAYRVGRQSLYTAIGHLFGAIQVLTDINCEILEAVQRIDLAIVGVETGVESIEQSIIAMVSERKRTMGVNRDDYPTLSPTTSTSISNTKGSPRASFSDGASQEGILGDGDSNAEFSLLSPTDDGKRSRTGMRRNTAATIEINRRRQQSIRPETTTLSDANDTLGSDHHPDDIEFGPDNNTVKGGTLSALVERLTVHDTLDTNFIATFLLTYRSFCTTEEFIGLLEDRYNILPPERLTPEQLEVWTERKQKLVRLRVFNVMKNWLENYYIEEDERLLTRLEYFTNSNIRDSSLFAANQLLKLIRKRIELSGKGEMKKIVQNPISGPDPIMPKSLLNIQLLDTDPLELARQLSIMDFRLYSSIRPIELLGKAWSREGADGSIAVNIKQSIHYCNRLTAWVTSSILSHEEPKKRATIIKYWAQVADHCRSMNNYNTCMAVLSAFDNSAVGRLRKTWMMSNRNTTQSLAQIRKLMGANRNFTEYRLIIHSVNPPCIPFLGIYLQDLTFIEDGNPDYLKKSSNLINFAKRSKVAEVIRELKQFQSFAYNFHTISELQDFIKSNLDQAHDTEKLYERSLLLEPRTNESNATVSNILATIG